MGSHWLSLERELSAAHLPAFLARHLSAGEGPKDKSSRKAPPAGKTPAEGDELPYRVELWNADKTSVEQVVAVTASASIGQAAFYAAAREYPERYVTLRHKQMVINRWNGPSH